MNIKKIGIIGCGTIGCEIAKFIKKELFDFAIVNFVYDIERGKSLALKEIIDCNIAEDIDELFNKCDFIFESASRNAVPILLGKSIETKKDIMFMSVGGLLDQKFPKENNIYIPSGAIAGIDAIKAFSMVEIKSAILTTRKPPKGLAGAPFVIKNNINLNKYEKETVIFEGSPKEAIDAFPANINVAVALSLAVGDPDKVKVKIVVVPNSDINSHEIVVESSAGKLTSITENLPSPENPKTSYLAILSAKQTLKQIFTNVKIGT